MVTLAGNGCGTAAPATAGRRPGGTVPLEFPEQLLSEEVRRRDTTSASVRSRAAHLDPQMVLEAWYETAEVTYDRARGHRDHSSEPASGGPRWSNVRGNAAVQSDWQTTRAEPRSSSGDHQRHRLRAAALLRISPAERFATLTLLVLSRFLGVSSGGELGAPLSDLV